MMLGIRDLCCTVSLTPTAPYVGVLVARSFHYSQTTHNRARQFTPPPYTLHGYVFGPARSLGQFSDAHVGISSG